MPQPFSSVPPLQKGSPWTPLPQLQASPEQMAVWLAAKEGFVWLDSSLAHGEAVSLFTAMPASVLQGSVSSGWDRIEALVCEGQAKQNPGGLFGWAGYDGQFILGVYPHALLYDHTDGKWFECGGFLEKLGFSQASLPKEVPVLPGIKLPFEHQVSRETFIGQVRQAKAYISAGDIYQVNLSHPWRAPWPEGQPFLPHYLKLRQVSPAPHSACLSLAGTTIFSTSPELFLKMSGPVIATHPIKGTRPRFPDDPQRDAEAAKELLACDKERAELLMITDLERNDLGKVCEYGSVRVPDLWRVESFAQVYHLVSTVTGLLRPGINHAAAFKACFPGGSISGAPKKRAMEIIAELEEYPRGLYTGAVGYFGFDGQSQWNIAIRTAVQQGAEIRFHVGSGIVADSVPEKEWEETLHKSAGLLSAWT